MESNLDKTVATGGSNPAGPAPQDDATIPSGGAGRSLGETETLITPQQGSGPDATTRMTPSDSRDPIVGARIGNYRVLSVLGGGGFGMVYKAEDTKLGRTVALKFLRNPLEAKHMKLFEREAKALAKLGRPPGIVQIYEWGEYQGMSYFALEYVTMSADRLLSSHPEGLPLRLALRIVAEVAEALEYAHGQGILHRDIKPANILLDGEEGAAKLADFGLTRFYEGSQASMSGGISGSPPYMSPEQASGGHVDRRSDVFSLGTTLFELLSARRPFRGGSQLELLENIRRNQRTPLNEYRRDLPPVVYEIVDKATAHKVSDRFQNAGEMAKALRAVIDTMDAGEDPATIDAKRLFVPTRAPWQKWAFPAAVIVVLVAIALILAVRPAPQGGGEADPLSQATQCLDRGDIAQAAQLYEGVLAKRPEDPQATYGLAYAYLKQGKAEEARTRFDKVKDGSLRIEGHAAVDYEQKGPEARVSLEEALGQSSSAYPKALLAMLDVGDQKFQDAVARLAPEGPASLKRDSFNFGWQYAEALQALGQAYFRLKDFHNAQVAFDQIAQLGEANIAAGQSAVANAYAEMAKQQMDQAKREAVREQIARVKAFIDQGNEAAAPPDPWKSRALTFFFLPVETGKSRFAAESGLADVLPWMLGEALTKDTPMTLVNREFIGDVLAEQELATLSSREARIALGQVLGGRLLIACKFGAALNEDFLLVTIVDTENTVEILPEQVTINRHGDPKALIGDLANAIWAAVHKQYPLKGHLRKAEQGATIDIGSEVGVEPGMKLAVSAHPDVGAAIQGYIATVEPIRKDGASVSLEGFTLDQIPPEGLYVFEKAEEAPAPAGAPAPPQAPS